MRKVEIEWIPTEERFPEGNGKYLVCRGTDVDIFEWGCPQEYGDGYRDDGFWDPGDLSYEMYPPLFVKAWAYLPEPYKED